MNVLVLGGGGQLGLALQRMAPPGARVRATTRAELDVTDEPALRRTVAESRPDWILNASAYTAVDRAETEPDRANLLNAVAVAAMARAAADSGARLLHVSTDFVFDGTWSRPYRVDDPCRPLGEYGRSKLAGEQLARERDPRSIIVRTSWVHSSTGANFVRTMLRLMQERDVVRVVADQVGAPTWASSLAWTCWRLAELDAPPGLYHWCDDGCASWYDFAVAAREEALAVGLVARAAPIVPIATADYPTPARRPAYSLLDNRPTRAVTQAPVAHWRENLRKMLNELRTP